MLDALTPKGIINTIAEGTNEASLMMKKCSHMVNHSIGSIRTYVTRLPERRKRSLERNIQKVIKYLKELYKVFEKDQDDDYLCSPCCNEEDLALEKNSLEPHPRLSTSRVKTLILPILFFYV